MFFLLLTGLTTLSWTTILSLGLLKTSTSGTTMLHLRTRFTLLPPTARTNVVGTPNLTTDVGTCASRVINSASVSALPVDPTDLFYNKHAPYHDTVNPRMTTFDNVNPSEHGAAKKVTISSPWNNCHGRPAATSCGQQ